MLRSSVLDAGVMDDLAAELQLPIAPQTSVPPDGSEVTYWLVRPTSGRVLTVGFLFFNGAPEPAGHRGMVVRVGVFPENTEATKIPGVRANLYLAVDGNDEVIAPMRTMAEMFFDYRTSDDPGWDAYGNEVFASDAVAAARDCAERAG